MKTSRKLGAMGVAWMALCLHFGAAAAEAPASGSGAQPGVVDRVEHAVVRGAKAAASGVERGAKATARGVERGAKATARGVKRGAHATANAASRVANKLGGPAASSPPAQSDKQQ